MGILKVYNYLSKSYLWQVPLSLGHVLAVEWVTQSNKVVDLTNR